MFMLPRLTGLIIANLYTISNISILIGSLRSATKWGPKIFHMGQTKDFSIIDRKYFFPLDVVGTSFFNGLHSK